MCLFLETTNAPSFSLCEAKKKGNLRELQAISFIQVSPCVASLFHPLVIWQKGKRNIRNKWNKNKRKSGPTIERRHGNNIRCNALNLFLPRETRAQRKRCLGQGSFCVVTSSWVTVLCGPTTSRQTEPRTGEET